MGVQDRDWRRDAQKVSEKKRLMREAPNRMLTPMAMA